MGVYTSITFGKTDTIYQNLKCTQSFESTAPPFFFFFNYRRDKQLEVSHVGDPAAVTTMPLAGPSSTFRNASPSAQRHRYQTFVPAWFITANQTETGGLHTAGQRRPLSVPLLPSALIKENETQRTKPNEREKPSARREDVMSGRSHLRHAAAVHEQERRERPERRHGKVSLLLHCRGEER